ncbi:DPY30 domain-containing protein 1 isoform X2 [Cavia porcellus]|uniref:DPY30 domain-containing protein 1 isoform X2 n=1 Tax=Cavia porcellus TaxID=10141 RepID=UPI002FE22AF9
MASHRPHAARRLRSEHSGGQGWGCEFEAHELFRDRVLVQCWSIPGTDRWYLKHCILDFAFQRQKEMAQLEHERAVALAEQELLERLRAEELLFQQEQLALQLELEMQERERQRIEELGRAQEQLDQEMRMNMENIAKSEDALHQEEGAQEAGKTIAEISDRFGAPNLSRVEEVDEPMLPDVTLSIDQDL